MVRSARALDRGLQGGAFGVVTLALGATFLASAAYLTLRQAIQPGERAAAAVSVDALGRLSRGEREDAARAARATLASDPLNAAAIVDLARIAEAEGDTEAAERLKLIAGGMRPRATVVQAEALSIMLKRRDFDGVMARLDGLIRARPNEASNFFALAAAISADEDGSRAVARLLATNPPWRARFFSDLLASGQAETAYRIMSDLRAMGRPFEVSELRAVIDDHLRKGNVDRAYAVWLSSLSDAELKSVKRIYDGDFSKPVRSLHFDWTVKPADGFAYRLFPRNTASLDQTMQIDFLNFVGPFSNLSQMLRLRPGRFRLSGEARFEAFASGTGLVFRLYCLDGGGARPLSETGPLPQSNQWIAFERDFEVPASGCKDQLLQLESRSPQETGEKTRGMVALDAINIDSLPDLVP